MFWMSLTAAAAASAVSLAESATLGPADHHQLVSECDCVRARWLVPDGERVLDLPRSQIVAVVQTATGDGQQEVALRTRDGGELVIQRAPCASSSFMATSYAALLQVSRIGDAAETACVDLVGAVVAYEARRFQQVDRVQVALVSVAVIDRRGEPLLAVQRGLSGARALLAHCFVSNGTPTGSVDVRFVARTDGTVRRVRASGPDAAAVGPCLVVRLEDTHLSEVPATAVKARAALTLE